MSKREINLSHYERIKLDELAQPKTNHLCLVDHYWVVDAEGHALIFTHAGYYAPQCNPVKAIADRFCPKDCTIELVPVAYVKNQVQ